MKRPVDDELRRLIAIGGTAAWLMVGAPVLVRGANSRSTFVLWLLAWLAFFAAGAATFVVRSTRARLALLAADVGAVAAMVLLLCHGFEGALLVLVAMRVAGTLPRKAGLAWVLVQTAALAAAIAVHWTPSAALLLVPPYFGFQILAYFVGDVLARSDASHRELAHANDALAAAQRLTEDHGRLAERVRIARELHDAVGHRLTALALHLEAASRVATPPAEEAIATARELAKRALQDVRATVSSLRYDDRIDLSHALQALAAEFPEPRVHLELPRALECRAPEDALALLRCAQEIMTNCARHACAKNLWIDVAQDDDGTIQLHARDDGIGVDVVRPGHGIGGMRERLAAAGGALEIDSRAGDGFRVRATIRARES